MKKAIWIITAIVALIAIVGVFAAAQGNVSGRTLTRGTTYEQMSAILENGTYADLQNYRETSGFNVMPWVQDEQDFQLAKVMHEKMQDYNEGDGVGNGFIKNGFGKGNGFGNGGCPMLDQQ